MKSKACILFVDDEPEFLKMIIRTFRNDDHFSVDVALSPKDALELLEKTVYDAIISDWNMPAMDGGTFLSIVANRYPDATRGLMTGVRDVENIAEAVNRSGVERIFLKPLDLSEMRKALLELINSETTISSTGASRTVSSLPGSLPPERAPVISIKNFVRGFLAVAESLDPIMVAHARRVASYAAELYDLYMNRPNNPDPVTPSALRSGRNTIVYASLLHDSGKLFVDRRILEKGAPLHASEVKLLQERLSILRQYATTKALQDNRVSVLVDEISQTLNCHTLDDERWNRVGSRIMLLSSLTREIRSEINLTLIDTNLAESLLGSAVGTLTRAEREAIEHHTLLSERIVSGIPWPENLSRVPYLCRHHHERLDGSGYPDGLKEGYGFTPELRVLSVADVYDAVTDTDRSYRAPLSHDEAMEHLQAEVTKGRLDGKVVETAIRMGKIR
jgi:response regulator RpfG family c-di-GMP phosphodiesterase